MSGSGPASGLVIGTAVDAPGEEVALLPHKLNRHTFFCGQSGSGKTYALGVLLEQVLIHTGLPLLVLDPNADFSRITEIRPGTGEEDAAALGARDIRLLSAQLRPGSEPLRVRFRDLGTPSKGAVLQMDPIRDAEEYNTLLHADALAGQATDVPSLVEALGASGEPGAARLRLRLENLEVLDWDLWAWGGSSATDVVDERPDATVVDLGGFSHHGEAQVTALALLEHLWRRREERRPVLVVIDEAHNVCPAAPRTEVERVLTDQVIQIAAEGRKFGLWLLLSTQRPTKVHPNVLTQCDNLTLMRMNSPKDLLEIGDVFGFVPPEVLARATSFRQGQALFAGGFVPATTVAQMGTRLTAEGGSDVAVPLR